MNHTVKGFYEVSEPEVVWFEIEKHEISSFVLLSQDCFDLFGVFCILLQILELFVIVLLKMSFVLHSICRLPWVVWLFNDINYFNQ